MDEVTSNQYYGGINLRFEKRRALLTKMGFEYKIIKISPRHTAGIFTRGEGVREQTILACVVNRSTNRMWNDDLQYLLRQ